MVCGHGGSGRPNGELISEKRAHARDEMPAGEEGIVPEFDLQTKNGKVRSLAYAKIDNSDSREPVMTMTGTGDEVLMAPFSDPDGRDRAKSIRMVDLNA